MKMNFDYSNGDFCYDLSGGMMMDSEGNLMQKMSSNMAMEMDTGELHMISRAYESGNNLFGDKE